MWRVTRRDRCEKEIERKRKMEKETERYRKRGGESDDSWRKWREKERGRVDMRMRE